MPENFDFAEFLHAYIVAALWSSSDDNCEPLDARFSKDDVSFETREMMRLDCAAFVKANAADLVEYCARMKCEQWTGEERAGHDFWLTRNGHGVGFWDRDLDALGDRLTAACESFGEVFLYVGDDARVYC
jgi:hypothetical protein